MWDQPPFAQAPPQGDRVGRRAAWAYVCRLWKLRGNLCWRLEENFA